MKDVPMALPEGLTLAVICEREDPLDAFVSNQFEKFADLPQGASRYIKLASKIADFKTTS